MPPPTIWSEKDFKAFHKEIYIEKMVNFIGDTVSIEVPYIPQPVTCLSSVRQRTLEKVLSMD